MSESSHIPNFLQGVEAQPSNISAEIKKKLIDNPLGFTCKCCGTKIKARQIKLTIKDVLVLLDILKWYRHSEKQPDVLDYFTKADIPSLSNIRETDLQLNFCFFTLMAFDLIENKGSIDEGGKFILEPGYYRISPNGIKWAQREIATVRTAYSYKGEIIGHKLFPYYTITELLEKLNSPWSYETIIDPRFEVDSDVWNTATILCEATIEGDGD